MVNNIPNLLMRARREEEALEAEFGVQWVEYRERVPAWIPRLKRVANSEWRMVYSPFAIRYSLGKGG